MPGRRRAGLWIAGILGVAAVASLSWVVITRYRDAGSAAVVYDAATPLPVLTKGLREGDARALLIMFPRLTARMSPTPKAVTEDEAKELIEILNSTRVGFLRFGGYGRVSSLMLVTKVLERFAVEEAPPSLVPGAAAGPRPVCLGPGRRRPADPDDGAEPGRPVLELVSRPDHDAGRGDDAAGVERGLYAPVLRRLGDREPQARAAAVACLGQPCRRPGGGQGAALSRGQGGRMPRSSASRCSSRSPSVPRC